MGERLSENDGVIQSIVENFYTSPGSSLRSLAEIFRASLNKSVNDAFRAGSLGTQFHADASIDGIALRFLECPASDGGDGSTKAKDIVDSLADPWIIEL